MDDAKRKRKNYLINKRFQLKYTLAMVLLLLSVMVVSGLGLYFGMWGSIIENFSKFKVSQNLENVRRIAEYEDARYKKGDYRLERIFREAELLSAKEKETLKDALASVNRTLIPKVAALAVIIFIGGIFISHKIAGPMYRIEQSAEAIREGDLRVNFNLRKSDEMKEAATVLEEMVKSLHDDVKALKASSLALDERVAMARSSMSKEDAERLGAIIKDIDSVLAKYKT